MGTPTVSVAAVFSRNPACIPLSISLITRRTKRPGSSPGLSAFAASYRTYANRGNDVIGLRERREHIRSRSVWIHLNPFLGDLALGIDQERVAIGHGDSGKSAKRAVGAHDFVVGVG